VPGIAGLLARICQSVAASEGAQTLLTDTVRWILGQQRPNGSYPSWLVDGVDEPSGSNVAWCYGELGVAAVLLAAARALHDRAVEGRAIETALICARRQTLTGTRDAGLCHGAAGNAHIFNRLFQATNDRELRDAAVFWYQSALNMRLGAQVGVGGYRTWQGTPGETLEFIWNEEDQTFLTGGTGIALTFLAATAPVKPEWDIVLLSDLEPENPALPPGRQKRELAEKVRCPRALDAVD